MKIKLLDWGARNYSPCPPIRTLRAWAATGQIYPPPEKVGRDIMVDERAIRVPAPANDAGTTMSDRAMSILHAA